jgi:hypothetical protein
MKFRMQNQNLQRKFSRVYSNNLFNGRVSLSGNGSDLIQTKEVARALPNLIKALDIRSMLDIPCGDLYWISKIDLGDVSYIGADVVQEVINNNIRKYGSNKRVFAQLDITNSVPPMVDLVFSRDLFVHLSTKDIESSLRNIVESNSLYLAMTTFTEAHHYRNLRRFSRGVGWRPINFQIYPWNFPAPFLIINENCTEQDGKWNDKSIGVWLIEDLRTQFLQ